MHDSKHDDNEEKSHRLRQAKLRLWRKTSQAMQQDDNHNSKWERKEGELEKINKLKDKKGKNITYKYKANYHNLS